MYIEASYGMLFDKTSFLLSINDMFLTSKKDNYILNIIMEKAFSDVKEIMKEKPYLDFESFYSVFKDTILGLCFMHLKNISHRNIKPENIMKFSN